MVQLFFIVFGLPALGLKLTAGEAALLAMLINLGAYSTEIIRAGIQVTPKQRGRQDHPQKRLAAG